MNILEKRRNLHKQNQHHCQKIEQLESLLDNVQGHAVLAEAWAMAAHEINNLLSPLVSYAQLAIKNPQDEKLTQKALEKTLNLGQRAGEILQQIPLLAGKQQGKMESCSVKKLVDQVFSAIGRDFKKDCIEVLIDLDEDLEICVDLVAIRQMFMNLILNAREAMFNQGGKLIISSRYNSDTVDILFKDTGTGIAPNHIDKIFEPFFTLKTKANSDRQGSGIGLAYCKRVVESHKGEIMVQSRLHEGSTFIVRLPKSA